MKLQQYADQEKKALEEFFSQCKVFPTCKYGAGLILDGEKMVKVGLERIKGDAKSQEVQAAFRRLKWYKAYIENLSV